MERILQTMFPHRRLATSIFIIGRGIQTRSSRWCEKQRYAHGTLPISTVSSLPSNPFSTRRRLRFPGLRQGTVQAQLRDHWDAV